MKMKIVRIYCMALATVFTLSVSGYVAFNKSTTTASANSVSAKMKTLKSCSAGENDELLAALAKFPEKFKMGQIAVKKTSVGCDMPQPEGDCVINPSNPSCFSIVWYECNGSSWEMKSQEICPSTTD